MVQLRQEKSDLVDKILPILIKINHVHTIKYIRCDNAGENKALEEKCSPIDFNFCFEYTPRDTPQHNGVVERCFQTLYSRMRAMLNGAGIFDFLRKKLWAECARTSTILHNVITASNNTKSPYEQFYGHKCKIISELRVFGEIGVVKTVYTNLTEKMKNKGKSMMFIGYSLSHGTNVFRMLNLDTLGVSTTRDVVWLNKTYGQWISTEPEGTCDLVSYELRSHDTIEVFEDKNHQSDESQTSNLDTILEPTNSEKIQINTIPKLMDKHRQVISTRSRTGRLHLSGLITGLILLQITDIVPDPMTFSQAWNNPRRT